MFGRRNPSFVLLLIWTIAPCTEAMPPLAVTAMVRLCHYEPATEIPERQYEYRITIYTSNQWWRIRAEPCETNSLPIDCRRIEGGIRWYVVDQTPPPATVTNYIQGAYAFPLTYPPPEHQGMLLGWLAYVPHPELPILEGHVCRRFLFSDLAHDPLNKGTFLATWIAPESNFLASLLITNNGYTYIPDRITERAVGPFADGWREFEYEVQETIDIHHYTIPSYATLRLYHPRPGATNLSQLYVYLSGCIWLLDVRPLEAAECLFVEPKLLAFDYRPSGNARMESLNITYLVTNDIWKPLADEELQSLVAIEQHIAQHSSTKRVNFWSALVLIVLFCPLILIGWLYLHKLHILKGDRL